MLKKDFLTVRETAETLGIAERTVRAWILSRKIGTVKLGRAVRIPGAEITRLVRQGSRPAI